MFRQWQNPGYLCEHEHIDVVVITADVEESGLPDVQLVHVGILDQDNCCKSGEAPRCFPSFLVRSGRRLVPYMPWLMAGRS